MLKHCLEWDARFGCLSFTTTRTYQPSSEGKVTVNPAQNEHIRPTYGYVRYADDFLVTAKTKARHRGHRPYLAAWAKPRGLAAEYGKDPNLEYPTGFSVSRFFSLRHYRREGVSCRPQKEKVFALLCGGYGAGLKQNASVSPAAVILPKSHSARLGGNYYKHGVSKGTCLVTLTIKPGAHSGKWCCSASSETSQSYGLEGSYYVPIKGRAWTFSTHVIGTKQATGRTTDALARLDTDFQNFKRHVKVKGRRPPPETQHFKTNGLADRQTRIRENLFGTAGSKYYKKVGSRARKTGDAPVLSGLVLTEKPYQYQHSIYRLPRKRWWREVKKILFHLQSYNCHQYLTQQ